MTSGHSQRLAVARPDVGGLARGRRARARQRQGRGIAPSLSDQWRLVDDGSGEVLRFFSYRSRLAQALGMISGLALLRNRVH